MSPTLLQKIEERSLDSPVSDRNSVQMSTSQPPTPRSQTSFSWKNDTEEESKKDDEIKKLIAKVKNLESVIDR